MLICQLVSAYPVLAVREVSDHVWVWAATTVCEVRERAKTVQRC